MSLISGASGLLDGTITGTCQSPLTCGFNKLLGPVPSFASAVLLSSSLSSNIHSVDSFISFISLQSSYAWYMKLSQFETVFLGLVMLQISVLRYLEILPINVNNFFLNDPTGRRRRKRSFWKTNKFNCDEDILIKPLLRVLKKVDEGNCLSRTLCELESMSKSRLNNKFVIDLPKETNDLLDALKTSSKYRSRAQNHEADDYDDRQNELEQKSDSHCAALDGLKSYEDAVLLGSSSHYPNSTICEEKYSACPLTKEDITEYIGILIDSNFLVHGLFGIESAVSKLSALLLLLGVQDKSAEGIITNVSIIQSWRWFFHLSPFESVFLAFIIAQIGALSLLGILPINLPELWNKNPAGRRKKRQVPPHVALAAKEIGSKMLNLYKKLDQNGCGFRALCELQSKVSCGDYDKRQLPQATQVVLTTLLSYGKRSYRSQLGSGNSSVGIMSALEPYAEAVQIGSQNERSSTCEMKYPVCPVTTEEIIDYVDRMNLLDF